VPLLAEAGVATEFRLAHISAMTPDEIRQHLENADGALTDALTAGAGQPDALAPAVLEMIGFRSASDVDPISVSNFKEI
jgi:hypothetical protein